MTAEPQRMHLCFLDIKLSAFDVYVYGYVLI